MKELFEKVKADILHDMPAGCLVTKEGAINFDIGLWQHKSYANVLKIRESLCQVWCPRTINLLILDMDTTLDSIKDFVNSNSYDINLKESFGVYCIAVETPMATNELSDFLKTRKYPMNRYHIKLPINNHMVYVCDFVKNLLYY